MSKAFTKETDDGPDDALDVEDITLPAGEKNYVTPRGLASLREAASALRAAPRGEGRERQRAERRLAALERRLAASEVVDPATQPGDRVLFGATVTLRDERGATRRHRIVGVDEADSREGSISWRSPLARSLLDLRLGDVATLHSGGREEELEVVGITYEAR